MSYVIRFDPDGGHSSGQQVSSLAEQFRGITTAFQGAVSSGAATAVEVPAQSGFGPFGEIYVKAMLDVEQHAGCLGNGGQNAATLGVQTDQTSAANLAASSSALPGMNR
jgi:hypothetical protein